MAWEWGGVRPLAKPKTCWVERKSPVYGRQLAAPLGKPGENARMKLATYQDGSRDGQLVVVSRDLSQAHYATHIANRLQQVLDDWNYLAPQLQDLYVSLNQGRARHAFPFDPARCLAPLPRAFQWADGSAYLCLLYTSPSPRD